ncbi:MAG: class I SAM-dependent methyltransferase [Candidatus Pacebacteria bacterium]|nr:class I SAM-dependent methyltransferase [Candidatus Paceibacterota bacterium]
MQQINCPVCEIKIGSDNSIKIYTDKADNQNYKLYHCDNCDLEFWNPRKIAPDFYIDQAGGLYDIRHDIGFKEPPYWTNTFFVFFKKNNPNLNLRDLSLLDIGCGEGSFIKKVKTDFKKVSGIDFDKKSVFVGQQNNLDCQALSLSVAATEMKEKFDVFSFFEVLEHQEDVKGFFDNLKVLGNNNFFILGTMPNRNRITANLQHNTDTGDFPPHHFIWWSAQSLKFALEKYGFDNIVIETYGDLSLAYIASCLESMMLGSVTSKLKDKIKKIFTKKELKDYSNAMTVEELGKFGNDKKNDLILKILKFVKNLPFYLPAMLFKKNFERENANLYFEARYKKHLNG